MQGKICLIGERLAGGGAERVMAELSQVLTCKGYEVHVVTVVDDIQYAYSGQLFNLGRLKNKTNGPWNKLKRLIVLKRFLKQHQFDAIIDFRIRISFWQELILNRLVFTCPVLYTVHSSALAWYFPSSPTLAKWVYGNAKVVAVSSGIVRAIQAKYPQLTPGLIYNGIHTESFANVEKIESDDPFVFMAGRMDNENKQFDVAIRAFDQAGLANLGFRFYIAGKGALLPTYQALVQALKLEDSVHFMGHQSDLAPYLKAASATLLTSQYEGFPRILVESLACGTPVISYDCPTGPSEIVQDGVNGRLLPNQSTEALTEALRSLHTEPEKWKTYRDQAAASAQRWDWEEIGPNWVSMLKKV